VNYSHDLLSDRCALRDAQVLSWADKKMPRRITRNAVRRAR
jgi:hypothetical protein